MTSFDRKTPPSRPGPDRRQLVAGGLGALAGLSLVPLGRAAAGGPGSPDRILERARQLVGEGGGELRVLLPAGSRANVEPVAQAFQKATGVRIRLVEVPVDDINAHVLARTLAGGADFDLALPATFGLPDLVAADCLHPLDEFAETYASFEEGDGLYELGDRYDGRLWGYQTDGDAYVFFYNRRMLEDERLRKSWEDETGEELGPATTWEELDRMMAFVHDPERGVHGGTLFRTPTYMAWEWWIRLHAKGVYPVDDDMRPRFTEDACVEALVELLAASRHQYPEAATAGLVDNWKAFARGDAFCNIGWGGTQKYLHGPDSKVRGALLHTCPPGGLVEGRLARASYFNWGWNWTVAGGANDPELSYLLALFATSTSASTLAVRATEGFFDPFRESHYEDPEVVAAYSPDFLEVHAECMRNCIPDFYLRGQSEYFGVLHTYLGRCESGAITPRRALEVVARAWEQTTDRIGRERQAEDWRRLKALYPAGLRAVLT